MWATVLALAWLQVNFASSKDEWEMIETKAQAWMTSQDLKGQSVHELLEKAKQLNLKM